MLSNPWTNNGRRGFSRLEAMLRPSYLLLVSLLFNRLQCQYHLRDIHLLVFLLKIDHSFSLAYRSVRPQTSQLFVPVRCQWLLDRSASLPVRNLLHQLLLVFIITGTSEMLVLNPARPASQLTVTQSATGTSVKPLFPLDLQLSVLPLNIQTWILSKKICL